jgi:hypothetical protein
MCFFYSPCSKKYFPQSPEDATRNYQREIYYTTLAGRLGKPNPHLKEFAVASREIRPYGKIIKRWNLLEKSPVVTDEKQYVFNQAFEIKDIPGTAVLVLNSDVGELMCEACKKSNAKCDHVAIDDQGNLKNFHSYTKAKLVNFSFTEKNGKSKDIRIFRVDTGEELKLANERYSISIDPGSAKILFIGTPENAARIHQWYKPLR